MSDYTDICNKVINTPEFKQLLDRTGGELLSTARQFKNGTVVVGVKSDFKAYTFDYLGQARESDYTDNAGGTNINKWRVASSANVIRKPDEIERGGIQPYIDAFTQVFARFDKRDLLFQKKCEKINTEKKRQVLILAYLFEDDKIRVNHGNGIWIKPLSTSIRFDVIFEMLVDFFGRSSFVKDWKVE